MLFDGRLIKPVVDVVVVVVVVVAFLFEGALSRGGFRCFRSNCPKNHYLVSFLCRYMKGVPFSMEGIRKGYLFCQN